MPRQTAASSISAQRLSPSGMERLLEARAGIQFAVSRVAMAADMFAVSSGVAQGDDVTISPEAARGLAGVLQECVDRLIAADAEIFSAMPSAGAG